MGPPPKSSAPPSTTSDHPPNNPPPTSNSPDQGVEWEYELQNMLQPDEVKWFRSLAKYFSGRPRSMGRVINSYNLSRYIVDATMNPAPSPSFYRKLIKLILMAEIWPYRTSWLLQIAEDTLQQQELARNEDYTAVGKNLPQLLQEISK